MKSHSPLPGSIVLSVASGLLSILVATTTALGVARAGGDPPNVRFTGASVYDGRGFVKRPLVSRDGVFIESADAATNEVSIDGLFVLPAFGDAHTHRFTAADPDAATLYLSKGFAYVFNLNGSVESRVASRKDCNTPSTPEVRFAGAGFTTAGGHPQPLYTWLDGMNKQNDPATVMDRIGNFNFFVTDSLEQLNAAWPKWSRSRPDAIKIFLLHSELWSSPVEGRRPDGLKPELASEIARRAKADRVRIAAHVESAADARVALRIGVDLLAHMPGYGMRPDLDPVAYVSSDDELRRFAEAGIAVTPTHGLLYSDQADKPGSERVRAWKTEQLARWKNAGVRMLYGSDNYFDIGGELQALIDSGVFSNDELVRLLAVETPRWILPGRAVGSLDIGSEATFVVLGADPLDDPKALSDVRLVVRSGVVVWARDKEAPANTP